jgi:anti-sigma factor RsiW
MRLLVRTLYSVSITAMEFIPASDQDAARAITRLVDGTLSASERETVEAWATSTPDVARQVAAQRRVAQELASGGPAPPDRLLAGIEQRYEAGAGRAAGQRPRGAIARRTPARPLRGALAGLSAVRAWAAGGAAAAAAAVALVLAIGAGSAVPTIGAAAALAYRAPSRPAPAIASARYLDASYGDVTFPNYATLGAVATGQLVNRIGGRPALTVYYRLRGGGRLSYTVFSGRPVRLPAAAHLVRYEGVPLRVYQTKSGLSVVMLVRFGRTCVLAASTAPGVVLGLAAEPVLVQHV